MQFVKKVYLKFFSFLIFPLIEYYIRKFHLSTLIQEDVKRYKDEGEIQQVNKLTVSELFLRSDLCFRDVLYYRCQQKCHLLRLFFRPYPNLIINCDMAEGGAFFFHHPFSTYINASYVGYGCTFRNNTTIGNKKVNGIIVAPRLEGYNNIGVNACVIGGITIGKYSLIEAGSVVVKDVDEGKVVAGNPARVIKSVL